MRSSNQLGFTLVEMLLVITIISIMGTLTLIVVRGAQEDSRAARTQSIISRTREILLDKIERYEVRNMPFRANEIFSSPNFAQSRYLRKRLVMEWIRSEIPSYFDDLSSYPSTFTSLSILEGPPTDPAEYWPSTANSEFIDRLTSRPAAGYLALVRYFNGIPPSAGLRSFPLSPNITNAAERLRLEEGAVLLYAILHNTWYNDQRGTYFLRGSEIGTAQNGFPMVLDAWGEPLFFLVRPNTDIHGDPLVDLTEYIIDVRSTRFAELN